MSDEQKYTIQGLTEYIRQGEPQQRERSEAWRVAIVPKCKSGLPKCKSGRRIASKVQKLHFGRGGAAAHSAKESVCHPKRHCHGDREIGAYGQIYHHRITREEYPTENEWQTKWLLENC